VHVTVKIFPIVPEIISASPQAVVSCGLNFRSIVIVDAFEILVSCARSLSDSRGECLSLNPMSSSFP
jgi:hypothetical protein